MRSRASLDDWHSKSWKQLHADDSSSAMTTPLAWYKQDIPYVRPHNRLQTLDVYIPAMRSPESAASNHRLWVIYIHGGAWRDPMVDSRSMLPAVRALLSGKDYAVHVDMIAGIASVNYSLSPHPKYPPGSLPKDAYDSDDHTGSRTAKHPQHIQDVKAAVQYLHKVFPIQHYVVVGHSCGATLAFQTIMPQAWSAKAAEAGSVLADSTGQVTLEDDGVPAPIAIAGVAGLYDLPALVHSPGERHAPLAPIYREFLTGAFGPDEGAWQCVSPITGDFSWPDGLVVMIAASAQDTLVPETQKTEMIARLDQVWRNKDSSRILMDFPIEGDHNDSWEDGRGLAQIISGVVGRTAAQLSGHRGRGDEANSLLG